MADNSAPTELRLSIQASREGYSQDGDFRISRWSYANHRTCPAPVACGSRPLGHGCGVPHSYVVRLPGLAGFQGLVAALGAAVHSGDST